MFICLFCRGVFFLCRFGGISMKLIFVVGDVYGEIMFLDELFENWDKE